MEGHTCALLNTCEESHRTKRIVGASMNEDSWRSCSRQPGRYQKTTRTGHPSPPSVEVPTDPPGEPAEPSRDDLDIGMEAVEAVEPMTPLEEARETGASTEVGEQSVSWRRHGENLGQENRTEIPSEETGGSPQFKRARLEEPLEDEQEKTGEDETEQLGPENMLMTKNPGKPNSSTASSILDKRPYDREISFHQLCTKADVPLYQEAERVQWDEWVTHGSVKIHSLVEAGKIRQQVPRERRLHSRFAYRNENAGLLDPACNPWSVKAKARLVIQGQHCPDNAQGLVRTDAPTVHGTAVSVFFQLVSSMGWCRSLKGCGCCLCLSARTTSRSRRAFVL